MYFSLRMPGRIIFTGRRITDEHRLVYQMEGSNLIVFTCRYHY